MSKSPVCVWDITLKAGDETEDERLLIIKSLRELAKKWCFQLERGEQSDYLHWQIRLSLFKKKRQSEFIGLLEAQGWEGFHVSPTSKAGQDSLYCMKVDTRVEGPWADTDKKPMYVQKRFRNPVPMQWQSKLEQLLIQMKQDGNDRNIVMVKDDGGEGKSWFKGWMQMHRSDVITLPSTLEKANEMMEFLCSLKEIEDGWDGIILMDVPRATSPKHWWTLAAGLETIKQGILHDKRYHAARKVIEPPQICCFMNKEPPEGCMTSDVFVWFDKDAPLAPLASPSMQV